MLTTSSLAQRSFSLLALTTALCAVACGTQTIGGNTGGDGGAGGTTTTGVGAAGGAPSAPNAVAESAGQTPVEPSGSSSSSGGGGTVDPGTLRVRMGNYGLQCFGSLPYHCPLGTAWEVRVDLPPAMQVPGVYSISDSALNGFFTWTGSTGDTPDDCTGASGSFVDGTIEVVSNDGTTIVVKLSGWDTGITGWDADGQYTAPICNLED